MRIKDATELNNALTDVSIAPGTTLELENGTYTGDFVCGLHGTEASPINLQPRNLGGVVIDGSFTDHSSDYSLSASYVHIYDIEFTDSRFPRVYDSEKGITFYYPGMALYGCFIHDTLSMLNWFGSGIGAVEECVFYNNLGYAIYSHNDQGGLRTIARNFLGNQALHYVLHVYSASSNKIKDYRVIENIICGDDSYIGGGGGIWNLYCQKNIIHGDIFYIGRDTLYNNDGTLEENRFISLESIYIDESPAWAVGLVELNNEVYGHDTLDRYGNPFSRDGYTIYDLPTTKVWTIPFSKSRRWLGSVTIYNRDSADTVAVNFGSILGNGVYALRNCQNMVETWSFPYTKGRSVLVPMNIWSASDIIGGGKGENHLPVFGTFFIEKISEIEKQYMPFVFKTKAQEAQWRRRKKKVSVQV